MTFSINSKKVVKKFIKSGIWFFILLGIGIFFLAKGDKGYFFIFSILFVISFLPRLIIFLNHFNNAKKVGFDYDVASKRIFLRVKGEGMVIEYKDVKYVEHILSSSMYGRTTAIINTPWEDFFYIRISLLDGSYYNLSGLIFGKEPLSIYGIEIKRTMSIYPFIVSLHGKE
jgi:hypothetical protein